jgi:mannose-6-phosphate isomerase-like protein (cupin superfamily)
MRIFDLNKIQSFPYEERGKNVFYYKDKFKTRIINLTADEEIPECEMASYVIFYVIEGEAEVTVNSKKKVINSGMCMITEPAKLSLKTDSGVKVFGIQINIS